MIGTITILAASFGMGAANAGLTLLFRLADIIACTANNQQQYGNNNQICHKNSFFFTKPVTHC